MEAEGGLRLGIFLGTFFIFALIEALFPTKSLKAPRTRRWASNLFITLLNTSILRLLLPGAVVGVAAYCQEQGWGLSHQLHVPDHITTTIVFIVLLDMIIYFQHRLFHELPLFWRLHRVHHSDPDFDVTTASRFHPIEILLSAGIKIAAVAALGIHPQAVFIFEVILSSMAIFNHGNYSLPEPLDKIMRAFIVTPNMHRIHHSQIELETNSNYGFNISLWDRIFGTYCPQAQKGDKGIDIGLEDYPDRSITINPLGILMMPFK